MPKKKKLAEAMQTRNEGLQDEATKFNPAMRPYLKLRQFVEKYCTEKGIAVPDFAQRRLEKLYFAWRHTKPSKIVLAKTAKNDARIRVPVVIYHKDGRIEKTTMPLPVLDPYSNPSLEDGELVVSKPRKRQVKKHGRKK